MVIVSRQEWGANPRSLPAAKMRLPATAVFVHHSVTAVTNNPHADMRAIERIGLTRFNQFSYSHVIHPKNGEILEGCGLRRGAHTAQENSTSFGICWAGNYDERQPKIQQVDSTRWLIGELKRQGHLRVNAKILGHRDTGFATACPGSKLYAMLDTLRKPWGAPEGVAPMWEPPLQVAAFLPYWAGSGGYMLLTDGGVGAVGDAPYRGPQNQPIGHDYWLKDGKPRKAARIERLGDHGYRILATTGERYDYP